MSLKDGSVKNVVGGDIDPNVNIIFPIIIIDVPTIGLLEHLK